MPRSSPETADLSACRALMRGGSRTFFAASLLLPRRVYEPATALYAFCRLADDAIDEGEGKEAALVELRARLDRAYAGDPLPHPADRAFAAVVASHHVPRILPLALLEGFAWDAQGRRYATLADLHDYAARVAGTVGAMMAVLMGVRDREALARACDLGIAMQLTNIARDVGEDARAGRLYLPLDWLHEAGIDPDAWLATPEFCPAIADIVRRLLAEADTLYTRAQSGIAQLPAACRPGIRAAGLIYAGIGRAAERAGYDTVSRRAHVSATGKLLLLTRSLGAALPGRTFPVAAPLPAACYLVEAAALPGATGRRPAASLRGRLDERALWVFDLFQRLQAEEVGAP